MSTSSFDPAHAPNHEPYHQPDHQPYHHGDVPERVLDVAYAMLDEVSAADISVRELARRASVSHAAPYRHFTDRAGFLVALAVHSFGEFIRVQRQAFDDAAQGDRLSAVGRAYVAFAVDHPHAFALIFDPSINTAAHPPAELAPLVQSHAELLAAALADGFEAGRIITDADAADVGAAMWSAAHGLADLVASGRIDRERVPAILDSLLRR